MKKLFVVFLVITMTFCIAGCKKPIPESPPKAWITTPDGKHELVQGGCNWTHKVFGKEYVNVIADQSTRPIAQHFLESVTIDRQHMESILAPVPGTDSYEAINSLGCLLKLDFEVPPTSVTYTCWPDTVWQDSSTPEREVIPYKDFSFWANLGGYVYEIVAEWDEGSYYGTANYYVHVIAG